MFKFLTLPRFQKLQIPRKTYKVQKPIVSKPATVVAPQPLEKRVRLDFEITEFEVRVLFSTSILAFSMAMLATRKGDPGVYMPLITSIIGYWTPSPSKDK